MDEAYRVFRVFRQADNSILFTFDSIVDIHLGAVMALRKDFLSGEPNSFLDYSFLGTATADELKVRRIKDIGKDVYSRCFLPEYQDKAKQTYDAYMKYDEERIIKFSPVTNAYTYIMGLLEATGANIKVAIISKTEKQADIITQLFQYNPLITFICEPDFSKIDGNSFARIVVGDINQLNEFKSLGARHLTILNYASNLQLVQDRPIPTVKVLAKYGQVNALELMQAYNVNLTETEEEV